MKINLYGIIWVTAIVLAVSSAFYSVYGLSQLFSGAAIAIIIVASILESSKVVLATYIHDYWSKMAAALKIYMTFALLCLMIITSLGVYGFLTSAYQATIKDFRLTQNEISKFDIKIQSFTKQVELNKKNEVQLQTQIENLQQLKTNQDKTISTVYSSDTRKNTKLLEKTITSTNLTMEKYVSQLNDIQTKSSNLVDSINLYETKKMELQTSSEISEVGPLMYISKALSIEMDTVVNYLVLLIMFVFDPLAVALVFAANSIKQQNNFDNTEKNTILYDEENVIVNDITNENEYTTEVEDKPEPEPELKEKEQIINEVETPKHLGFFERRETPNESTESTNIYGDDEYTPKYSKKVTIQ